MSFPLLRSVAAVLIATVFVLLFDGWSDAAQARLVAIPTIEVGPQRDNPTPVVTCGKWSVSARIGCQTWNRHYRPQVENPPTTTTTRPKPPTTTTTTAPPPPTTTTTTAPVAGAEICDGLPRACITGLKYWQRPPSIHTEIKVIDDPDDQYSGWATWNSKRCDVVIYRSYSHDWEVYAHELGHCKGLDHDEHGEVNRPGYRGIMDYDFMWSDARRVQAHDHAWENEVG